MTLTVIELHTGDRVADQGDHLAYEVRVIDAQNGRVQVVDTAGEVHTYHRSDTVDVIRAPTGAAR